ncbi:PAS domain-containing protein [Clostridium bornimense]|uniref:sensor histidine kinase n=1 Tax=Clostridium bornimense TaxID=1216932 RepID=UPI001C0F675E|nr:HAMP domain-containing sensor histidine kinase [Clostridium bornimense]MBU5317412.1 PAS domain-containing protein [Clostridium bornimense]
MGKMLHKILIYMIGILIFLMIVIHVIRNVKKMRNTEQKLLEAENEYKELIETLPEAILIIENDKIVYINQYGLDFFEVKSIKDMSIEKLNSVFKDSLNYEKLSNKSQYQELELTNKEGNIRNVEVRTIRHIEGKIVVVITDITERFLSYENTERERLKNEFFGNLSHEFKTPINVLLSTAQLLEVNHSKGITDHVMFEIIKIIKRNSYRLLRLVDNLIESTKIDTGSAEMNYFNYDIVQVTEDLVDSCISYANNYKIKIIFDTEVEELKIALDIDKYEKIILNLISNAIKYNKENGEIFVNLLVRNNKVVIEVIDTGIGIAQEKIKYIFQRFMQINKSFIRDVEGSGIGLYMVKSLVELHKGEIEVESVEGKGSKFIVTLPKITVEGKDDSFHSKGIIPNGKSSVKIELSDL